MPHESKDYLHTDSTRRNIEVKPSFDGWVVVVSDGLNHSDLRLGVQFSDNELLLLRDHISKLGIPERS